MSLIVESKSLMTTIGQFVLLLTPAIYVSKEKCKANLENLICNEDNLQVDYLNNVHINWERKKK
jgi:hypothetical protein